MRRLNIPTTFLLTLIASGCTSQVTREGNPFDEPLAREPLQAPAAEPGRILKASPRQVPADLPVAQIRQTADIEPDVQVYPAGAVPTPISSTPNVPVAETPAPDSGREALAEAEKVATSGDTTAMIELLEQSAFRGNMDALYRLAKVYQNGEGVPANPELAVAYLTTASGLGHVESTRVLAWDYLLGKGVTKDIPYGTALMEKAAETSVRAKREFALLLNNTYQPNLNDPSRAKDLLSQAAAAGDSESARALSMLNSGLSVPRTLGASASLVVQPRTEGDPADVRAESLKQKAYNGDIEAMYRFALGLSLGKYPSIDGQFEAYCWYAVAANHGHAEAAAELSALAGVKTLSERKSPGKLDQCIQETNEAVDQG
ncbi:tetratricopeptide repeat protein [Pseudomonas aeruginosa]|uniref:tetratricopeptide repeat protein n=1 Tax=Pseudomonas TaxID=286 RepID=UPI0002CAB146|nr:tetratricopeptide repeat protein [Pseudomonas sp. P179]EMZ46258.1 hypothetical protein HMPREF1224_11481 [Pseudomonas sp. P179]